MKFAPITIPALALLQQHDARRDVLIKPAAQRRAAIEARGIPNWGRSELGAQSGRKTNRLVCLSVCLLSDRTVNSPALESRASPGSPNNPLTHRNSCASMSNVLPDWTLRRT